MQHQAHVDFCDNSSASICVLFQRLRDILIYADESQAYPILYNKSVVGRSTGLVPLFQTQIRKGAKVLYAMDETPTIEAYLAYQHWLTANAVSVPR